MEIKITAPTGKYSIITTRDQESKFYCAINHISSTEEQPFIAINFDESGKAVGGRTMQKSLVENVVATSKKNGFKVEGA